MIGRLIADDIDDWDAGAPRVVQIREAVREPRPAMQQCRGRSVRHARISVRTTGHHALEQAEHASHSGNAVQGRDEMHFARAWIGEAGIHAAPKQRVNQAFRPVHGSALPRLNCKRHWPGRGGVATGADAGDSLRRPPLRPYSPIQMKLMEDQTRRLAVILCADVAGYARLMHENEESYPRAPPALDECRDQSGRRPAWRPDRQDSRRRVPGRVREPGRGSALRLRCSTRRIDR